MSTTIKVGLKNLGATLIKHEGLRQEAMRRGLAAGADRGQALLVRKSKGVNYMGQFMNSWHVPMRRDRNTATVRNDAPHAGIIEAGARPHGVNGAGRLALLEWVLKTIAPQPQQGPLTADRAGQYAFQNKAAVRNARKALRFGFGEGGVKAGKKARANIDAVHEAAMAIVVSICRNIKANGVKGHWIVKDNLDKLGTYATAEIMREIRTAAGAMAFAQALGSAGGA